MRQTIDTGLPEPAQPFAWATRAGNLVFTNQGPVQPDGTILQGAIDVQARLTFDNLRRTLTAAGGSLANVMAVTIYLLDGADMAAVDRVYRTFFDAPFPTRASLVVAGLVAPGMRIEVSATAVLGGA